MSCVSCPQWKRSSFSIGTAQIGLRIIPSPVVSKPESLIPLAAGNCALPYMFEYILLVFKLVV
ncbi:unnamed protein product, partial [Gulo gulo]